MGSRDEYWYISLYATLEIVYPCINSVSFSYSCISLWVAFRDTLPVCLMVFLSQGRYSYICLCVAPYMLCPTRIICRIPSVCSSWRLMWLRFPVLINLIRGRSDLVFLQIKIKSCSSKARLVTPMFSLKRKTANWMLRKLCKWFGFYGKG